MEVVPITIFGVAIDIPLLAPVPYAQAQLDTVAAKICDPKTGIGVRPEMVRLRKFDELFDYELSARFFGENGSFTQNAERVKLSIRNGRNAADWNIVKETLTRFYAAITLDPATITTLSAHVHAPFPSDEERNDYMQQFAWNDEIARPAAMGYVRIADWEKDIRILIEPSNIVPDALFIAWDTQFENTQDWDTFLSILPTMMENSAHVFGLGFEPLAQP